MGHHVLDLFLTGFLGGHDILNNHFKINANINATHTQLQRQLIDQTAVQALSLNSNYGETR